MILLRCLVCVASSFCILDDIQAVKAVVDRLGADKVLQLVKVLSK